MAAQHAISSREVSTSKYMQNLAGVPFVHSSRLAFTKLVHTSATSFYRGCMVVFFLASFSYAQSGAAYDVLLKSFYYYKNNSNLMFDMQFKMFASHASDKVVQEMSGYYQLKDNQLLVKMGGQTQLNNKKYALVVDEGSKTIMVQNTKPESLNKTPFGVDSLVKMFVKISLAKEENGLVYIHFEQPKASFYTVQTFDLVIEKNTGILQKAILYYAFNLSNFYEQFEGDNTIPRIEIEYLNYKQNLNADESFDEKRYVIINAKEVKPTPNYKDYRILDVRNQTNNSNNPK